MKRIYFPALLMLIYLVSCKPQHIIQARIDGLVPYQGMDGIGVNINTGSWQGNELKPALDLFIDSMEARQFRVIVETPLRWEAVNDNEDPFVFNRAYYDSLYETPKFVSAWETIAYLNARGITDGIIINFMGYLPPWLGGETIAPGMEDEYVEMLASFFHYARFKRNLRFGYISPTNEPDIEKEGPRLDEKRWVAIVRKLVARLEELGMGDIRYIGPDPANMKEGVSRYIPAVLADSMLMSKMAYFGIHSYGGYYAGVDSLLKSSAYSGKRFWVTEWNAWRNGLDDGQIGMYNYTFSEECMVHLFDLLRNGASAAMVWEGFDSYYDHHAPSLFSYWGILGYDTASRTYMPRKHFYAISQVSKYLKPGARRIALTIPEGPLTTVAFFHPGRKEVTVTGANLEKQAVQLRLEAINLPGAQQLELVYTDSLHNLRHAGTLHADAEGFFFIEIPARCIFTLHGRAGEYPPLKAADKPEPAGWYAGDMHVHRNCGDGTIVYSMDTLRAMMNTHDLAVMAVLADIGHGEVKDAPGDMRRVNGKPDPLSAPGRIIQWDAEWHWDAVYTNFSRQALGGHLVFLGLQGAEQIWEESAHKVLERARQNGALAGFCHLQYLNGKVQEDLNCCIPLELPVEAAMGTLDFVSVDVYGSHSPNPRGYYFDQESMGLYYRMLNCGIRLPLTAGTDFPCNELEPPGSLLTYSRVDGGLTYSTWLDGIRRGRTVITRTGHTEFLDLKINDTLQPGGHLEMPARGKISVKVRWTSADRKGGNIELLANGKIIASQPGIAAPGKPQELIFETTLEEGAWIAARRTAGDVYYAHTSPIYITVQGRPLRAKADDAHFFVQWIDNLLLHTEPGGKWRHFFPNSVNEVRERYSAARAYYANLATVP